MTTARSGKRRKRSANSRTVLLAATIGAGVVDWAVVGDAALVHVTGGEGRQLNRERTEYLGSSSLSARLDDVLETGRHEALPGDVLVAVTDGLSQFVFPRRPAEVIARALEGTGGAEAQARAVVREALNAYAGDNVAVALAIV